jgi:DNA-binding GntR family transcriptional regulator
MPSIIREMTLKDKAYEQIKIRIVSGEWTGGTFLTEKFLSDLLQMSKTPIRSALDRLEMNGLVKLSPKQGIIVQEVSLKKVLEIYELRLSLETFAARHLTGKLSKPHLELMDANLVEQADAIYKEDIMRYVELDETFHEMLIKGLDNEEFNEVMTRIQDKFLMAVRATFIKNKERLWGSLEEHKKIREAIAGDDPDVTENLVAKHIEYVKTIML